MVQGRGQYGLEYFASGIGSEQRAVYGLDDAGNVLELSLSACGGANEDLATVDGAGTPVHQIVRYESVHDFGERGRGQQRELCGVRHGVSVAVGQKAQDPPLLEVEAFWFEREAHAFADGPLECGQKSVCAATAMRGFRRRHAIRLLS